MKMLSTNHGLPGISQECLNIKIFKVKKEFPKTAREKQITIYKETLQSYKQISQQKLCRIEASSMTYLK